ncbi:MAG: hypothetical protein KAS75_01815 [Planctomycetes bacterium]|nr:hypothetical protein [Planctomycetota bacterium]
MGKKLFISAILLFGTVFSGDIFAIDNPNVRSPVGSATVPPSSYSDGLVTSPNPIDRSSDLVVTGNVGGGKHFRGILPYNAVTDFGGRLGSSTLDTFLRRSYNPSGFKNYSGGVVPYYSQTRTVTSIGVGTSSVFRPSASKIKPFSVDGVALKAVPLEKTGVPDVSTEILNIRFRPLSMTVQEMEKLISIETTKYLQAKAAGRYEQQMERFQKDLEQVSEKAKELERKLVGEKESFLAIAPPEPPKPEMLGEQPEKVEQVDVFEQMKQQLAELNEAIRRAESIEQAEQAERTKKADVAKKDFEERRSRITVPDEESEEDFQRKAIEPVSPLEGLTKEQIAIKAKAILGEQKSFVSFRDDKFNGYLRAGEGYLKQGKYYRAADAYTLAIIYKPNDPLGYAGKSHALFAAGEYMSSALFLARALEIFPEYAKFKIDIEAMVGDKDKLESRVVDVGEWQRKSESAELQFLLGYIYHQMDRPDQAKIAIDEAYKEMPNSLSVYTLWKVISGEADISR